MLEGWGADGMVHRIELIALFSLYAPVGCSVVGHVYKSLIASEFQCFGSGSMRIHIDLPSWIRIGIDLDLLDPDPD
jgi:hypothetical protein